jgi:hypothetical protein
MANYKKKKTKFNNEYNIPNEKADEVRKLDNQALIERTSIEYKNWLASRDMKKNDPEITRLKDSIKDINEHIKEDPDYQKAEAAFVAVKEALVSEELARFKEELKNLNEPYNEDIKFFRGMFQLAMDEISNRKANGLLQVK